MEGSEGRGGEESESRWEGVCSCVFFVFSPFTNSLGMSIAGTLMKANSLM